MSKIKVKNFGPIKDGLIDNDGWIHIKKVTMFIGNQGSGKSTIAKLISTFTWLEKALVRGDIKETDIAHYNRFRKKHCLYQNIHNFFSIDTEIEYCGLGYEFSYKRQAMSVRKVNSEQYAIPKVMYVPAERNFVSAVVQPEKLKYIPLTLNTFLEEFIRSNDEIEGKIKLPINNLEYRFDRKKRSSKLFGRDYEINLSEASSGIQSAIPLFLVSKNLAEGIEKEPDIANSKLSVEEKKRMRERLLNIIIDQKINNDLQNAAVELLSTLTKNDCFVNIVEEPEQNLYPDSQKNILNSLLEFNNLNQGNKLLMTTHSPYLINYLTHAVKAFVVHQKIEQIAEDKKEDLLLKLNHIVPLKSHVSPSDWAIYELNEESGAIITLSNYDGLPSDENFLNERLAKANDTFIKLLEIEDQCL